ncbi:MAG: ATP-dependent helicase [Lachnospira sp.]|nr:ATP-dependent helicase [Lachnospira sp.]
MEFNKAQIQAMRHFNGPCLTLAGPGSGKTTVLTHRIQYLIEEKNIKPENILVITFTKMAACEMKERFMKLSQGKYKNVTFGTFHSVYFMILRHAYKYNAENIVKRQEQYRFIKSILGDYELEINDTAEFVGELLEFIGRVKCSGLEGEKQCEALGELCPPEIFRDIYCRYQRFLNMRRYIDFEDMLVYCYELLAARKDILSQWQEQFRYILIDEFQDISKIQFDVILLLASKYRNIFIVGDDDQSIYGFRGACPDYMQEFERIYSEAVRVDLSINYRCTSQIVFAARSLIEHNNNRFQKDIRAAYEGLMLSDDVIIKEFKNEESENEFITAKLKELYETYQSYNNAAVLVRTNAGAALLTQHLVRQNIPFIMKEQFNNPFEHWVALDIMAYMRLAMGNRERKNFFRIINKPLRYFSREAFGESIVDFKKVKEYYAGKSLLLGRVEELESDIEFMTGLTPFAAVNYIRKGIGYEKYLKEYADEHKADYEELIKITVIVQQSAKQCSDFEEWFEYIEKYSDSFTEKSGAGSQNKVQNDGVNICTMHGAKGLEYETVFVIDVNEGIIPYHKAVLDSEIEEERRMFYVAMTRAKKKLYLCFVKERYNKKAEKSRFLEEINHEYAKLELLEE